MVAVSFIWLLALPHQSYSKHTYVSENALLPGSANVRFDWNDYLAAEAYRDVVNRISELPSFERADALQLEFSKIGLKSATQNYTLNTSTDSRYSEETLHVRSGAIQAALNLDFPGTGDYNALGIFFEGVNGQLPNLDMINTVKQISEGIAPVELTLHDELVPYTENMTKNYINSLKRMLYMMKYQATGTPTGNHGLYLKYVPV
ncbi:Glycosyl phosphatidyl inositol protein transamidase complex subunit [Haplosporangium sp. Z 27]|nr:Glycosyl phosphatidyl inositol protein transamidase complex subunit [Haplosporangium sp. Z 27]